MNAALRDAQLTPSDIDYINTHGTSTPLGDVSEVKAIMDVFGENAFRANISSTKSMTGHTLGAAGAVESVISVLSIHHGIIPPTINLHHPDPACDLDYVPRQGRPARVEHVMSNSFGFGGINAALILRRAS